MIRWLPPDSALARAADPDWWWWRTEHELLAQQIELTLAVNSKPGGKPYKVPRPPSPDEVAAAERPEPTWAEVFGQIAPKE